jgi:hypothetical protein
MYFNGLGAGRGRLRLISIRPTPFFLSSFLFFFLYNLACFDHYANVPGISIGTIDCSNLFDASLAF